MWQQSLCGRASLSDLKLTKGPDYFLGSDISQSVAHYCNRGLKGGGLGNVSGNDKRFTSSFSEWRSVHYESFLHYSVEAS